MYKAMRDAKIDEGTKFVTFFVQIWEDEDLPKVYCTQSQG